MAKKVRCDRCAKKVYPSQWRAFGAALGSSRLFGRALRAYECPVGRGWHLTTLSSAEYEAAREAHRKLKGA